MRFIRLPGILLILLCLGFAVSLMPGPTSPRGAKKSVAAEETSLQIVLRNGEKASPAGEPRTFVEGVPLSDERVDELRKMFGGSLPSPKKRPGFLKRGSSKPVPRATQIKELAFPTFPIVSPEVPTMPFGVNSSSPEGEVGRTPGFPSLLSRRWWRSRTLKVSSVATLWA